MSRRDSRANAERIVEATRRLWTDRANPPLEEIAAAAGVGIATLYRHFPNRAALERATSMRIFQEELAPVIQRAYETGGEDLVDVAEEFIEVIGNYTPILSGEGLAQIADEAVHELAEPFVGLLRAGQRSGHLRRDLEPVDILWVIRMLTLGLSAPTATRSIRRRYLSLMLTALAPENTVPLPKLADDDYDALGVPPEHRGPPV